MANCRIINTFKFVVLNLNEKTQLIRKYLIQFDFVSKNEKKWQRVSL